MIFLQGRSCLGVLYSNCIHYFSYFYLWNTGLINSNLETLILYFIVLIKKVLLPIFWLKLSQSNLMVKFQVVLCLLASTLLLSTGQTGQTIKGLLLAASHQYQTQRMAVDKYQGLSVPYKYLFFLLSVLSRFRIEA